jgi:spermidine synthase
MKPRITLAETLLADGSALALQEHDGRRYLLVHGQQIAGPATAAVEAELARLACAPFRPARQPKILVIGLGLGHALAAVAATLSQKRATLFVAEPLAELAEWHRQHIPDSPLHDPRVQLETGPGGLGRHQGSLHAIIVHRDGCPLNNRQQPLTDDPRWLAQAYEALLTGGLLAIGASRPAREMTRRLQRVGFSVAEHLTTASPAAKKARLMPIWLARKGKYEG